MIRYIGTIEFFSYLYDKNGGFIEKTHVTNHEIADDLYKIKDWMRHRIEDDIGGDYMRVTELISYKVIKREETEEKVDFVL